MTIEEARKKWGFSADAMIYLLEKGGIPNVRLNGNCVSVEDPKPFLVKKGVHITVDSIRKYILQAVQNMEYMDANTFDISKENFSMILQQLLDNHYIQANKEKPNCSNTMDFITTELGEKSLKKKKLQLDELTFGSNLTSRGLKGDATATFKPEK